MGGIADLAGSGKASTKINVTVRGKTSEYNVVESNDSLAGSALPCSQYLHVSPAGMIAVSTTLIYQKPENTCRCFGTLIFSSNQ